MANLPTAWAMRGFAARITREVQGQGAFEAFVARVVLDALAHGGVGDVACRRSVLRARDVEFAHKRGMPVYAYTVNALPRGATLVRMGIDGVITDRPFLASEVTSTQAREYATRP